MEEEQQQFDSMLGGKQELPSSINLMGFALARSKEIVEMRNVLKSNKSTKLAFQTLPKHMRRRCMSHNSNRLPRRLREIHLRQLMKSGMPPKQKQPSRKHRRRLKNLLNRQHTNRWLETHIWHAKRFHMIEKWGYRLPERPCDKSFRACYRATKGHCLLQDISYYSCIEIEGTQNTITDNVKTLCDATTGLTIGAKAFLKGNREGHIILFKKTQFLNKAIGKVFYHWKPGDDTSSRIIWIWVHAAYYNETLEALKCCCNVQESSKYIYVNNTGDLSLRELKYELNRLRLTGPLSNAILQEAFKLREPKNLNQSWLHEYLKCDDNVKALNEQHQYWQRLKNLQASQLSPHLILSLIICDPRYTLPKKRMKVMPDPNNVCLDYNSSTPLSCNGPIWNGHIREVVKQTKQSNDYVNNLRSNVLVPGSDLPEAGPPVPLLIIQRPGNKEDKLGCGSGWDIIVPSGWTQPIWLSLIMHGAKPGGIRETNSIEFELGRPALLPPDSEAGELESARMSEELKATYFRRPPNKRINYNKFAIACPFKINWNLLVKEWDGEEDFYVLRDVKQLAMLQGILKNKNKIATFSSMDTLNYIVPVKVEMERGKPNLFALICLPKGQDLLRGNEPIEPYKEDDCATLRKQVRTAHKTLLEKLKRKRKNDKKDGKPVTKVDMQMYLDFNKKMKELWAPETKRIRNSCSREIIGFVTTGDYCLTTGKGCGIGYVSIGGLHTLLSTKNVMKNKVLVRNTNSRQYRVASIDIAT